MISVFCNNLIFCGINRPRWTPPHPPPRPCSVILVFFRYHRAVLLKMSVYWYKGLEPGYKSMYCFLHQRSLVSRKMSAELNSVLRDIIDLHSGQNFLPHWGLVTVCRLTASLWRILSSAAVYSMYVWLSNWMWSSLVSMAEMEVLLLYK